MSDRGRLPGRRRGSLGDGLHRLARPPLGRRWSRANPNPIGDGVAVRGLLTCTDTLPVSVGCSTQRWGFFDQFGRLLVVPARLQSAHWARSLSGRVGTRGRRPSSPAQGLEAPAPQA